MVEKISRTRTRMERFVAAGVMGAFALYPYILAFCVFFFLAAKVLILRHWFKLLLATFVVAGIWAAHAIWRRRASDKVAGSCHK